MFKQSFNHTPIYYHLKGYFSSRNFPRLSAETVEKEKNLLIPHVKELAKIIIIPTSRIDDAVKSVIHKFGLQAEQTPIGIKINLQHLKVIPEELYNLTVLGQIEEQLKSYIIYTLKSALKDVDYHVEQQEKEFDRETEYQLNQYDAEMEDFSDGDDGYDYDRPIRPEPPIIRDFNSRVARANYKKYLKSLNLNDPATILREMPPESGLMGDLLHEHFEDCEFVDDLVEALDFSNLDKIKISHFFKTTDFYFPDVDILKPGFLLTILIDNIAEKFAEERENIDIDYYIDLFFEVISDCEPAQKLLNDFNTAAKANDDLSKQKTWYYLSHLCNLLEKAIANPPVDINKLKKDTASKLEELQKKNQDNVEKLIKVFPASNVNSLFYPGISMSDPTAHYPSNDANFPLEPIFYLLAKTAQEAHKAIEDEKTNVVTAMLCFVVSNHSRFAFSTTHRETPRFVLVPINCEYGTALVSCDEVFADEHQLESSIGQDLERGTRIAGRPVANPPNHAEQARHLMQRLLSTLEIDPAKKQEMLDTINSANIASPVMLEYCIASDIQKSTEHKHSERVLIGALKDPTNVARIIESLKASLLVQNTSNLNVILHTSALILYSYPNSICDPCGLSLLALQNSYSEGFLAEFIKAANEGNKPHGLQLRTRGYDPKTKIQDPKEFGVTVIAASKKIFAKDPFAAMVANKPEAKLTCRKMPFSFSEPGINLRTQFFSSKRNRLYEFTEANPVGVAQVQVYSGTVFMSGSKKSKVESQKKKTQLEAQVKKICLDPSQAATKPLASSEPRP